MVVIEYGQSDCYTSLGRSYTASIFTLVASVGGVYDLTPSLKRYARGGCFSITVIRHSLDTRSSVTMMIEIANEFYFMWCALSKYPLITNPLHVYVAKKQLESELLYILDC